LEEVVNIPNANIVNDEKKINELLKQTKAFTRDEFSKLLSNATILSEIMINFRQKLLLMK